MDAHITAVQTALSRLQADVTVVVAKISELTTKLADITGLTAEDDAALEAVETGMDDLASKLEAAVAPPATPIGTTGM